jgi:folate-binding protein YgfZ
MANVDDLGALVAAARDGALLHARPDLGAFPVTGGDRLAWLNGLVTQDVGKLAPGAGAYGLAVGKTGKIMTELWVVAASDRVLVVADRARLPLLREHFDRHLVMEDAEIGDPLDRGVLFAHGARAAGVLAAARARGGEGALVRWTGQGDSALVLAPENGFDPMLEATPLADEGWEALRIAWGVPRFGVDYDEQSLPQEASLETVAVSFSKGCYLGQETVFMLEKRGHARKKLVRLAVEGEAVLPAGAEIALPDGTGGIGAVTSATPAPAPPMGAGGWLALGSVKHKHTAAGTELVVAGRGARVLGAVENVPSR